MRLDGRGRLKMLPFVTTSISTAGGHATACRLGDLLLASQVVENFSFADCTSFVVMQTLTLADVFTFDIHFARMGFKIWPQS